MSHVNEGLQNELLAMAARDVSVRTRLLEQGVLHGGYHPEMEAVHSRNAARLQSLLQEYGWPTSALVGEDARDAAWLIVQHAIGEPEFQRECLRLLWTAASSGHAPAWQPAMLEDRIRMFEGRPQIYGTQLETGPDGKVRPYMLHDPEHVDERRNAVGLEPLGERLAQEKPAPPSGDPERFEREYQAWLRHVGWRQ